MAKQNEGKKFEDDFYKSLNKISDLYIHRLRDVQFYRGSTSIGDYFVFKSPYFFIFELKSVKGTSLPLSKKTDDDGNIKKFGNVNKKQFDMMLDVEVPNIFKGYIINFRKNQNTYFITAEQMLDFIFKADRKSIPESYCEKVGIKLNQEIKRVRYNYFGEFLDKIIGQFL